jgi:pyrroloquinoline quinone biosynthesis protein E
MAERPYTLVAELTYRCPLACAYCSNPLDAREHNVELDTKIWQRVLTEAEALGVMQVHFTGGEPLVRRDLEVLVRTARDSGLYTNLITSGVPLQRARLEGLRDAGLDHIQLSFQGSAPDATKNWANHSGLPQKRAAAHWAKELGYPLTVNVVVHRGNLDDASSIVALAEELGADRLELANVQYLGWALLNREHLLPRRAQIDEARRVVTLARERLAGKMEIDFVLPDYHADRPRPCMEGWARRYIVISPGGLILPCHAAHTISGLEFDNVRDRPLAEAWASSPALERFRGTDFMLEPCQSCEHRESDFAGCRCQAYHLTGDARAADPACDLAPLHSLVRHARERAENATDEPRRSLMYRRGPSRVRVDS